MKMVWDQRPGIALGLGFFQDYGKTIKERFAVFLILEDLSSFNSPGHDMLQKTGRVESGLPWHFLDRI